MAITNLQLEKGRERQRVLHLLIVKGSWKDLHRPSGYPIRPDRPHTNAGSTSHKAAVPQRTGSNVEDASSAIRMVDDTS